MPRLHQSTTVLNTDIVDCYVVTYAPQNAPILRLGSVGGPTYLPNETDREREGRKRGGGCAEHGCQALMMPHAHHDNCHSMSGCFTRTPTDDSCFGLHHLLQGLAEERIWVDLDLVADQSDVFEVTLNPAKDALRVRADDHDVVAVPHPPESMIQVVQVQVGKHGGEPDAGAYAPVAEERSNVLPEGRIESVDEFFEMELIDRGKELFDVEGQPSPPQALDMLDRRVNTVSFAVAVDTVGKNRSNHPVHMFGDLFLPSLKPLGNDEDLPVLHMSGADPVRAGVRGLMHTPPPPVRVEP